MMKSKTASIKSSKYRQALISFPVLILLLGAATGIGYGFQYMGFPETNIVIVYILSTLITARFTPGYVFGIAASIAATFTFNYFFTEPYYTFSVNDPSYIITFIIMTITALITSALTSKAKKSALDAKEKEAEASALYKLTNRLSDANDIEGITEIAVSVISEVMDCHAACLCFDSEGIPEKTFLQQTKSGKPVRRKTLKAREVKERIAHLHAAYDVNQEFYDFPVYGRETTLGVIRIPVKRGSELGEKQMKILHSMVENTALAMDRFYSVQERSKSREETEQERYRGNLLRAISHDLRTPLAGILGSLKILSKKAADYEDIKNLVEDIYKEADWLHALVENILNLTRLQDGRLLPSKEPEAVEEVIGVAVSSISRRYPGLEIDVSVPDELLLIPMDARLISQVFLNLLDNAVKHSLDTDGISVTVYEEGGFARFIVADTGIGIREEDLPNIFGMFYTAETRPDAKHGLGLGLPICEAIIKAHGGEITARNREDKQGAEFLFTLPMENIHSQ